VTTPLHPKAFRLQMETDARYHLRAYHRKRRWTWADRIWCVSLTAAALDVVTHRHFLGLSSLWALGVLMSVRIFVAGVLTVRELYVGK
jgi:hypothetical protein